MTEEGAASRPAPGSSYCPSSPPFRQAAAELAQRMAARYGSHPAVALWHIGNEYGCHVSACYCEQPRPVPALARGPLPGHGRLNEAAGRAVWSQRYGGWDEI